MQMEYFAGIVASSPCIICLHFDLFGVFRPK